MRAGGARARRARAAARPRRPRAPRAAAPRCSWSPSACWPRCARRSSAPPTSPSASSARRRRWSSRSRARSTRRSSTPWTTSRCSRSGWRGAPRSWPTAPSPRRGPPHDRCFVAVAEVGGEELGRGEGKTKKSAEQEAALQALDALDGGRRLMHLRSISMKGFKSFPQRTKLEFGTGRVGGRRPQRLRQVEHHRRRALGARRAEPAGGARPDDEGRDLRRRPRRRGLERRRGGGGDRQRRRRAATATSPRSRSCAGSTATARASTA